MSETTNGQPADPAGSEAAQTVANRSNGRLLTAEDVAELLGVTAAWVYEQSRAGRIPTVPLGRYRRYRPAAISAWVQELERPGGTSVGGGEDGRAGRLERRAHRSR